MSERREYVRVEASLPVRYKILKEEEYDGAGAKRLKERRAVEEESCSALLDEIRLESETLLPASLPDGMNPGMAKALNEMNRKLNLVLKLLVETRLPGIDPEELQDVNLSGGGLRMVLHEKLEVGQKLGMEIRLPLFPPSVLYTVARIARVRPMDEKSDPPLYETALHFIDISEEDREKIIRYVFQRQRFHIRNGLYGKPKT